MDKNERSRRWLIATLLASLLIGIPLVASGTHVDPVFVEGNKNCSAITGLVELTRFEPVTSGTQNGVTIVVTGDTFSWTSTVAIAAVFVKGGPGGNLYEYPGGSFGDTGLHAPFNPPPDDKVYGLSHVTFCIPNPTTTTTTLVETTTTVEDTTTTTMGETTTTVDDTTTTTGQETTTTTVDDTTTTTVGETTTTVDQPTTTVGETTTTNPEDNDKPSPKVTEPDTLPFTGANTGMLVVAGLALLGLGYALVASTRKA